MNERLIYPTPAEWMVASKHARRRLETSYEPQPTGCWLWIRARTTSGYGHFHYRNRYYQAHRFVYSVLRGPVTTPSMDHLCRVRACVNPDHLEPVSVAINSQRSSRARLTARKAEAIRLAAANGAGIRALARAYGVNPATVSRLVRGRIWVAPKDVAA